MTPGQRTVATLVANDLRILLRSRRVLFVSLVLPLLVWPLMLAMSSFSARRQEDRRETQIYHFAVIGSQADVARQWIGDVRQQHEQSTDIGQPDDNTGADNPDNAVFGFEEVRSSSPTEDLKSGEIDFYIEAVGREESDLVSVDPSAPATDSGTSDDIAPEVDPAAAQLGPSTAPVFYFYRRSDREASEAGYERMDTALREARVDRWQAELAGRGFPVATEALAEIDEQDVASAAQASGLQLGRYLTLVLVLFLISGGSVVAMDSLAGEKERGTLETLLTTAASRREIVAAKNLSILAVAGVITAVQLANLVLWVGLDLLPLPDGFAVPLTPGITVLLLVMFLPVAALLSGVLLTVSGYAKTYKEAQLLFFPVTLLAVLPTLASFLPALDLRGPLVVVPLVNVALAVKEILSGTFDWPLLAVTWVINAAAAIFVARLSARTLSNERLITATDVDATDFLGGPALFSRRVLRWFAILWTVFLVWQLAAGTDIDMRLVVAINMTLFLLTSAVLIRHYRLDPAATLALRGVKPQVWLAVLIGAPAGLIVTAGVSWLSGQLFPIPQDWLDSFNQTLLPETVPLWQLFVFLALAPAVCEEIAFRGVLLYGLRRRLGTVPLILVVGLVFGVFHVALFRILPTAFLGMVLTAVTLLTGSLFPAIAWHALHNALSIVIERTGLAESADPSWMMPLGLLVFAVTWWMLWRHGNRYPRLGDDASSDRDSASGSG